MGQFFFLRAKEIKIKKKRRGGRERSAARQCKRVRSVELGGDEIKFAGPGKAARIVEASRPGLLEMTEEESFWCCCKVSETKTRLRQRKAVGHPICVRRHWCESPNFWRGTFRYPTCHTTPPVRVLGSCPSNRTPKLRETVPCATLGTPDITVLGEAKRPA